MALEKAATLAIATSTFNALCAHYPEVERRVRQLLVEQLVATSDRLVEALYTPSAGRVKKRLVELARLYGNPTAGDVLVPLGQDHLAGLAGTTRETVNRVLKQEEAKGTVNLARNRIVITPALAEPNVRRIGT